MGVMKLEIVLQYSHSNQFSIGILVGTFGEGAGKINGIARYLLGCGEDQWDCKIRRTLLGCGLRGQSGVQVPLAPTGRWMSF
jgi:hypothetical protein